MEFPLTSEILYNVWKVLSDSGIFRECRCAVMSGYSNLFELLPELTIFPACVICSGSVREVDLGASRETEVAVLVLDEFRTDAETLEGHDLVDRTLTKLTSSIPGQALTVGRVHYLLHSVTPIDLEESMHTAWNITFTAKTSFILNN